MTIQKHLEKLSRLSEQLQLWQGRFNEIQDILSLKKPLLEQVERFNQEEQTFFKKWQYKVYDPNDDEHVDIKNIQWQQFGKKKCSFGTGNRKTVARF